ncbi:Cell division integral membrane protein, YggT and half-length relatives [Olavius sp. associated proteobacterium Delta 1]|nr:Cell division integral membrane protein, YggT and half-length relatives [Olavius sp. associated proteobacterium Delta 1]
MFVISNLLAAVAEVLRWVLNIFMWIVIARAILSWVNPDPYNPIVRFIHNVTEPVLYQIRRRIPLNFGGIDFSPIIVLLAVIFLQRFVVASLIELARSLR